MFLIKTKYFLNTGRIGAISSFLWFIIVLFVNRDSDDQIPWAGNLTSLVDFILSATPLVGTVLGFATVAMVIYYWLQSKQLHFKGLVFGSFALLPFAFFILYIFVL